MIGFISGKVLSLDNGVVLLENNGIGYEIICSNSVYQKLSSSGKGEVYTYMAVKEDNVSLYGFISLEEKKMFLKLISVSGVGPKMGITILSNMNVSELAVKIATSDVKGLSLIKGLGKKSAERIILELREKVTLEAEEQTDKKVNEEVDDNAIIALMSLGLNRKEAIDCVKKALGNGAKSIQEIVTYSIKNFR